MYHNITMIFFLKTQKDQHISKIWINHKILFLCVPVWKIAKSNSYSLSDDLCGIFVKSVADCSAAAKDGRIQVNDQIIKVMSDLFCFVFSVKCKAWKEQIGHNTGAIQIFEYQYVYSDVKLCSNIWSFLALQYIVLSCTAHVTV